MCKDKRLEQEILPYSYQLEPFKQWIIGTFQILDNCFIRTLCHPLHILYGSPVSVYKVRYTDFYLWQYFDTGGREKQHQRYLHLCKMKGVMK